MSTYYDRQGQPISQDEWAKLYTANNQRVAFDDLEGASISTVWLGLNHNFDHDGPPLIFETMIFGGKLDQEQWRYSTEAQALAGHAHAVELVKVDRMVP